MHVVGQDDPGVDPEWAFGEGAVYGVSEMVDLPQKQITVAIRERDGEEDAGAGVAGAEISGHETNLGDHG